MSPLEALIEARRITSTARLACLRDAAEAIAESIRETPVRSAGTIAIDRLLLETRVVLPDARLLSPFAVVERRALSLVAHDGTHLLIDPSDPGQGTPYEERIAARHPVLARAFAATEDVPRWPAHDVVFSTALAYRSIEKTLGELSPTRWLVTERERDAAREPSARDAPRYARGGPVLETITAGEALAPGVLVIPTPGTTPGHASVVFSHRGKIHVFSHNGFAIDAWSPYESKVPGLREAVRLRNVEAVVRGDASDPSMAIESMAIERALADRDARAPSFFHIVPAMAVTHALISPRLRPYAPSPFS